MACAAHAPSALEDHGIEDRRERPFVMQIGAAEDDRRQNAPSVGQEVPPRAEFRAIRWVRAGKIPPRRLDDHRMQSAHCHSIPRR
jgi:hypothetical protein